MATVRRRTALIVRRPRPLAQLEPATCCLGDNCQSSVLYGSVGSGQVRLGSHSGQCGLVRFSCGLWNDRQNDHLSKQSRLPLAAHNGACSVCALARPKVVGAAETTLRHTTAVVGGRPLLISADRRRRADQAAEALSALEDSQITMRGFPDHHGEGGHPPGAGCQGSPPAAGSGCGTPARTADSARSAWSTRGRRSRQSRPVARASFSASTAATNSWRRLRTCPDRLRRWLSGARSASRSQRRIEVDQLGPQWWPRESPLPRILSGQDRRQLGPGGRAGVLLQRSSLGVPGRPPARPPQQPADSQRDHQEDEQGPAEGAQPLGLGRGRCARSRGRGGRGWRQRLSRPLGSGRGRAGTLDRGRGPGRGWRVRGGPGWSRRFGGRLAR
jgi:hypothetical protein